MKIKTAELTYAALNWAVRKCILGRNPVDYVEARDNFSTSWNKGGPIIEENGIAIFNIEYPRPFEYAWAADQYSGQQAQEIDDMAGMGFSFYESSVHIGETPLIAAMRCYVASKLGEEVEIPDELA